MTEYNRASSYILLVDGKPDPVEVARRVTTLRDAGHIKAGDQIIIRDGNRVERDIVAYQKSSTELALKGRNSNRHERRAHAASQRRRT